MARRIDRMSEAEFAEWLLSALWEAYYKARRGKRGTVDEHIFELAESRNLLNLRDVIIWQKYEPGRGIAFVAMKPVPREIFAAPFKDRIVHHFLYDVVGDWWERRLINDSYSCRKGKGVQYGIKRMQHHIAAVSESYTKKAYVIKMDIQGYFMSLPRERLYERVVWGLDRQFKVKGRLYHLCRYLWEKVIFDDPIDGVVRKGPVEKWNNLPMSKSLYCQPEGYGIVIGNLSSQLLSNIYLDSLDRFVKYQLGYKHYGRYVDDFFIVVTEEELPQAKRDIGAIKSFLLMQELTLHPKKIRIQEVHGKGVPWLGAVVYPWGIAPGKRIKGFMREAAEKFALPEEEGEPDSILSYLGHMKHYKSTKFERELFDKMGWIYR